LPDAFDVFLSHNSRDKPVVEEIAAWLRGRGLRVWLDKDELRPGLPWQQGLEDGVKSSRSVAVFVGKDGMGAWQEPEMRAFLVRSKRENIPVIPVLLPGSPSGPQLTLFLEAMTWVDLRPGLTDDGLARLAWGITGTKDEMAGAVPGAARVAGERPSRSKPPKTQRARWSWGIGFALLGVLLALAAWHWRAPEPLRPQMYAVRVQVLDPQGQRVAGSKVFASVGNEPLGTPDGWWQVEIPAAKVPAGGRITLRAEHPEWGGNQKELRLGHDQNVTVEIRLKAPETWLRGLVVDAGGRGLAGVPVSVQDGGLPGKTMTDSAGRFALKLSVPPERRARIRAERASFVPGESFCLTGHDSCSILLEAR